MVFYTIKRFKENILIAMGKREPSFASGSKDGGSTRLRRKSAAETALQATISMILLCAGVYIFISGNFEKTTREAAAAWIGAVIGYWLR